MDVKSAYLYGEFMKGEAIYMHDPLGYKTGKGIVLWMKKPIYDLKKSGLQFHEWLAGELNRFEMVKCKVYYNKLFIASHRSLLRVQSDECHGQKHKIERLRI